MGDWIEASFLVPIRADANLGDGQLHEPLKWKELHRTLYHQFGGWTCTGDVQGCYQDPDTGQPVHDHSKRYVVALPQRRIDDLRAYCRLVAVTFVQKSIYFAVGTQVEFIEAGEEDGTLFDIDGPPI